VTAKIIDGLAIAQQVRAEVAADVVKLQQSHKITPGLAAVLVGDDPASAVYVRNKAKACAEAGLFAETVRMPHNATEAELLAVVDRLNFDSRFHGILVQLPLPRHIHEAAVLNAISPAKDADGIHPVNMGRLALGQPNVVSCTPAGVQQMLLRSGYDPSGRHVVICGRSNIVGKPLALLLMQKAPGANATVTLCHTGTQDLRSHTLRADILVAAAGSARMITADMVKPGVVVIDVGTNRVEDSTKKSGYRLVGDVDFDAVKEVAAAISPVPGGVGPMTIAMLLVNTVKLAKAAAG